MYAFFFFFFFNDTATTEIYTLSLHDALPIYLLRLLAERWLPASVYKRRKVIFRAPLDSFHIDRKSTRLNSSHTVISYAVFCLKKKKKVRAAAKLNQRWMRYRQRTKALSRTPL